MCARRNAGKLVGLTGNIACGKSTAAKILTDLGVAVVDADQIARAVTEPGQPTLKKIIAEFGHYDRQKMRELVFADPESRKKLEAILHPAIAQASQKAIEGAFTKGHALVVYEAPLLIEAGRHQQMDGVLLITCDSKTQKSRLLARDPGTDAVTAERMIRSQMSPTEKAKLATWIIDNDGTLKELEAKIAVWLKNLKI